MLLTMWLLMYPPCLLWVGAARGALSSPSSLLVSAAAASSKQRVSSMKQIKMKHAYVRIKVEGGGRIEEKINVSIK